MRLILACSLALIASPVAHAQEAEVFELKGDSAIVLDDNDMPVFFADRAFLVDLLGTQGEIFEVTPGRVRISRDGEEGVWLRCADLKPIKACGEQATVVSRSRQRDDARAGGVPVCPGDPRCPKRRSKQSGLGHGRLFAG
jgi:hypothetical protein